MGTLSAAVLRVTRIRDTVVRPCAGRGSSGETKAVNAVLVLARAVAFVWRRNLRSSGPHSTEAEPYECGDRPPGSRIRSPRRGAVGPYRSHAIHAETTRSVVGACEAESVWNNRVRLSAEPFDEGAPGAHEAPLSLFPAQDLVAAAEPFECSHRSGLMIMSNEHAPKLGSHDPNGRVQEVGIRRSWLRQ